MDERLCGLLIGDAKERDAEAAIEGNLSDAINGVLYRIGPGLFGRGARKSHALDGDGMVQRFAIADGRVHFRNRFVRTRKYKAEATAGRALFPTWSKRSPNWWRNLGSRQIQSQAGVTIALTNGMLLARDEVGKPWALDPETLATVGEVVQEGARFGRGQVVPKAHIKTDPRGEGWFSLACQYGRTMSLHVSRHSAQGEVIERYVVPVPRQVYVHDFFVTERYIVILLHPAMLNPLPFVFGFKCFSDCIRWVASMGNLWVVVPRDGNGLPKLIQGPAAWMWHGLNAYDTNGTIVVDWIGFDQPDHFLGSEAALRTLVNGRLGRAEEPGRLRRTIIAPDTKALREEFLAEGNFEFPTIAPGRSGLKHGQGYMTVARPGTIIADGVARIDLHSGQVDAFRFGTGVHIGEPILAGDEAAGWLMTEGVDARRGQSFLAVFDARAVADGPVARAWLPWTMPATFHGAWCATDGFPHRK